MATLENMLVFIRVLELGSFTAAGRSLRMSPAVVSYRIQSLERHLGCRLFNRTTRKLSPIGRRVIAPLVGVFCSRHPEIDVSLRLSDYLVDLLSEAVDVAVRMAPLADSSLIVRKIADIDRVLCAAPSYLSRNGVPASIKDLDRHQCLLARFPGSQHAKLVLKRGGRAIAVPVSGRIDADDGDVLTELALAGEGIVLKPVFEVVRHLKSGALVPVLGDTPPAPVTLAVLHAYRRMVPMKVRAFSDLAVEYIRDHVASELAGLAAFPARSRRALRA